MIREHIFIGILVLNWQLFFLTAPDHARGNRAIQTKKYVDRNFFPSGRNARISAIAQLPQKRGIEGATAEWERRRTRAGRRQFVAQLLTLRPFAGLGFDS